MIKCALKVILILIAVVFAVGIFILAPIDRKPVYGKAFYNAMMATLDTLIIPAHTAKTALQAGWHRENIIPGFVTPMAGYKPRHEYEDVHDSLFVNVMVLDNGTAKVALISYDLLITPPLLEKRLRKLMPTEIPDIDFIYMSASHTHNGIGGWDNSLGGQMMTGSFDGEILDYLEKKTLECVRKASNHLQTSALSYYEVPANKYVQNRLNPELAEDGTIRGVEISGDDGMKAILATYSAHATNIPAKSRSVSDDYPGQLTLSLERSSYDFAMFMAGAVGSHRLDSIEGESFDRIKNAGTTLASLITSKMSTGPVETSPTISFKSIPVALGESQLRVSDNLRLRDWAFNTFFAPLEAKIQYLEIGNILLLGMPCDFSGEILVEKGMYYLAGNHNKKLIVTSFNGGYIGYITEDHHYDVTKRSEIREMNWVGPYYGNYFNEIVAELLNK